MRNAFVGGCRCVGIVFWGGSEGEGRREREKQKQKQKQRDRKRGIEEMRFLCEGKRER